LKQFVAVSETFSAAYPVKKYGIRQQYTGWQQLWNTGTVRGKCSSSNTTVGITAGKQDKKQGDTGRRCINFAYINGSP
jgi:hypothetical protein